MSISRLNSPREKGESFCIPICKGTCKKIVPFHSYPRTPRARTVYAEGGVVVINEHHPRKPQGRQVTELKGIRASEELDFGKPQIHSGNNHLNGKRNGTATLTTLTNR